MNIKNKKILVILGPTATGKTDVALKIAKKIDGAIISCDSRQVFTGLDIGSGKYPNNYSRLEKKSGLWIVDGIEIYLYDVKDPKDNYSVSHFVNDANLVLEKVIQDGKLPIIVGGTGLYLKALLEGLPNIEIPANPTLRKKLEQLSKVDLQQELLKINPEKWENMNESDRQNPRRLIRYIEITLTGQINEGIQHQAQAEDTLKIGLTAPREILYAKVDARVVNRIKDGMIDEVKGLVENGLSFKRLQELGLEYRLLGDFLEDKIASLEGDNGLIKIMQNKIHDYVRRQLTWFKKEKNVVWFDISEHDCVRKLEKTVLEWYDKHT